MPRLVEIAEHLDSLLHTAEIPDFPNALNGVQVDSDGEIVMVAAAVDARERTICGAADAGANLLLVHHGLFWGGLQPLRGAHLRRIATLIRERIALYSSHLPLDAHRDLGNNVLLARELGLTPAEGFARYETVDVGVMGIAELPTASIIERADRFARKHGGQVLHSEASPGRVTRRWAICTGAGASADTLLEAAERGIDTLIVGEGPHWSAVSAEESGLTIIYAGHYATETLGVIALAEHVSARFGIPWVFIDAPTGL
jgi:dinuclear metal center YbgI/SA1388 family protein